ncbi:MAG: hypothetical protein ACJAYJ_004561 [Saprospiraceae bacterium]|jgi:hypothetical protein
MPSPPPSVAGQEAQVREKLDFYKNPIFLSPELPVSTKEYLSSYYFF